jgi:hypothetical protein
MKNQLARYRVAEGHVTVQLEPQPIYNGDAFRHATLYLTSSLEGFEYGLEFGFQSNRIRHCPDGWPGPMPSDLLDVGIACSGYYGATLTSHFRTERPDRLRRAARILDKLNDTVRELDAARAECDLTNMLQALERLGVATSVRFFDRGTERAREDLETGLGKAALTAYRAACEQQRQQKLEADRGQGAPA